MESDRIRKWIRRIACWSLFLAIASAALYLLIYFKIIDDELKLRDHIDFIVGTIAGFIIFIGLWKLTSWGWKFTIISTALFWIYSIFNLFIEYERFTGIASALFIIIDALILRFLFKKDVQHFFNITSQFFIRLNWIPTALFLLAAVLVATDFFDGIVGIVTVIGIFLGLRISKKVKKDLPLSEI
jgi:uncharacterized membrane protein (DUF2068 family)